ncbi:MAG: hypothetical protein WDO18_14645 [Acidobacteriota bacterium]
MQVQAPEPILQAPAPRGRIAGIFRFAARAGGLLCSGILLGFLGAILLPWQHHLSAAYGRISLYFLGLIVGLLASVWVSPRMLETRA